jgi:hypothetical protein
MPYSTNAKNSMLDHLGTEAVFVSLHSADPGDNGANELSGGSPAYARKAITWNAATGGSMDDSNVPVFDVPAGATVLYVGLWSAVTGGIFYGAALVTQETFGGQGTYTLTDMDLDLNA